MTPIPLGELRLWPSHHRSALWWLGLLYRRPRAVEQALREATRRGALASAAILFAHALPWMLLAVVLGRFLLFVVLIPPMAMSPIEAGMLPLTIAHVRGVAVGIAVGIAADTSPEPPSRQGVESGVDGRGGFGE